ncbi:cryptochrome/photolyase family protein [Streptomyces fuscigenes]|uniref:cryptochrome/photolyase family protein n=1 Tax=Streptomyces fuscigenes TaxID=1528880 RepID=UPI001F3018C4|nr:deoxyribodipyrimidine photo-lyase [Streptomyces fuscigenes]MCF3961562.1 DNA photolyase family protein [Streptomyces fuscigenes]
MTVAVVLHTSDLRVHDQPVLRAALRAADQVVPLFVRDEGVHRAGFDAPNRRAFLADCLASLDAGLRERGGRLVIRSGDVVEQVCRVVRETGAEQVHVAAGASRYALDREARLRDALEKVRCALDVHDSVVTALPPGRVTPTSGDHFAVFTPYFRRWQEAGVRESLGAPRSVPVPDVDGEPVPRRSEVAGVSPGVAEGGEAKGRERLTAWLRDGIASYEDRHDDLAGDATSRLSPYLHFGCLSPVELVHRARRKGGAGADAFVRQLAWRDFHHQVLAARPGSSWADYRDRHDRWSTGSDTDDAVEAWRDGRTGYPLVDAAMRQLRHEGWMHNRGRLLVASFLTKTLYANWRIGARHFLGLLVDGDIANNQMNWQWAAGTGTDTRPNRVLNPLAQARRFDADGSYVRRWVPELASVAGSKVHRPWELPEAERGELDYPAPVVDLARGRDRFLRARGA